MLNVVFFVVAVVLIVHFLRTGGSAMLRMMNVPEGAMEHAPGAPGADSTEGRSTPARDDAMSKQHHHAG